MAAGRPVSPQLYAADRNVPGADPEPQRRQRPPPRRHRRRAILVEPRNDENQIISQIHPAFLLFHNRMVDRFRTYEAAHVFTVMAYRWIVLHEFLPDIVGQPPSTPSHPSPPKGSTTLASAATPTTPVEFSVAAYRFGHSQVRRAYRLNGTNNCQNLQVFDLTDPTASLMGGRPFQAGRQINWGQFSRNCPSPPSCRRDTATSAARSTR